MNAFEKDTLNEIKAKLKNRQPVSNWEKQLVLDMIRRNDVSISKATRDGAIKQGFNVNGIKTV